LLLVCLILCLLVCCSLIPLALLWLLLRRLCSSSCGFVCRLPRSVSCLGWWLLRLFGIGLPGIFLFRLCMFLLVRICCGSGVCGCPCCGLVGMLRTFFLCRVFPIRRSCRGRLGRRLLLLSLLHSGLFGGMLGIRMLKS